MALQEPGRQRPLGDGRTDTVNYPTGFKLSKRKHCLRWQLSGRAIYSAAQLLTAATRLPASTPQPPDPPLYPPSQASLRSVAMRKENYLKVLTAMTYIPICYTTVPSVKQFPPTPTPAEGGTNVPVTTDFCRTDFFFFSLLQTFSLSFWWIVPFPEKSSKSFNP